MIKESHTWTRVHDLALIFVALAYGTDHQLHDDELESIMAALKRWQREASTEDVREIVMEAMVVYVEKDVEQIVVQSMEALREALSEEERMRALRDVVLVAESDGILLGSEQSLITTIAQVWDLKAVAQDLLEASTVSVEEKEDWSLMHDIGLIYVVMAHSTDNELSGHEITAILERLGQWQPDLPEEDVRRVVREALRYYGAQPDERGLHRSVSAIRDGLPVVQRLALLDDLAYIAQVDGVVNEHEEELLSTLSQAWGVNVRLNGHSPH